LIISEVTCYINVEVIYFHGFKFKVVLNCGVNSFSFGSNDIPIIEPKKKKRKGLAFSISLKLT